MIEPFSLKLWNEAFSEDAIIDEIAIDSRRISSPRALFVALSGEQNDGHHFLLEAELQGARFALVKKDYRPPSPLKLTLIPVESPLEALQEIAGLYRRQRKAKVIAITGSFGKTLSKDLLAAILKKQCRVAASPESFNSQLGVALSLLKIREEDEIALIEAGISQPGEMAKLAAMIQPDCAILTHIGKQHLDTLSSLQGIFEEKSLLLKAVPKEGWVLLPEDAPPLSLQARCYRLHPQALPSLCEQGRQKGQFAITFPGQEPRLLQKNGPYYLKDLFNIALKAAFLLQVEPDHIMRTLASYQPQMMSKEMWASLDGTLFINEAYSSDALSIDLALKQAALEPSQGRRLFLFGGVQGPVSTGDLKVIISALKQARIEEVHLFDEALPFEAHFKSAQLKTHCHPSLQEAARFIHQAPPPGLILIKGAQKYPAHEIMDAFGDSKSNQCLINLARVKNNIASLKQTLGQKTRLMVMVKALAYGTDNIRMARVLNAFGIDILGVATLDEAFELKLADVLQEIFVFHTAEYEIAKAASSPFILGVSSKEVIEKLGAEAARLQKTLRLHLHVDTGMGRLGCRPEETLKLAQMIANHPHLQLEGLFSHLSSAEDKKEDPFTKGQISLFKHCLSTLKAHAIHPTWIHLANSSGALRFELPECNMARVGLAIWGLVASIEQLPSPLQPALTLTSKIAGINWMEPNESVGYGRSYLAQGKRRIATLPLGYFDGMHRSYSGKAYVHIHGQKAPLVGNICMDYLMCDITHIPEASVGDEALLFGEDKGGTYMPPELFAQLVGSIPHELMTCLGPRIQRLFIYEDSLIPSLPSV
jgi:alanine racemase/UDP-N-acetylmuramoyl-tripeptide--D-alanyl-D-alanine ligase